MESMMVWTMCHISKGNLAKMLMAITPIVRTMTAIATLLSRQFSVIALLADAVKSSNCSSSERPC
jgi:hypothetical protein